MPSFDPAEITVLESDFVPARILVWITAKDRDTGEDVSKGYWNGVGNVTVSVVDGRSGATVSRLFLGAGEMLGVGSVQLTSDINVRQTDITFSQIASQAQLLVRGYDVRNAPVQIYRGYFDPDTRALAAAPKSIFIGYVDGSPIVTPKEGDEGSITLHCVSTTRELTRSNPDVRSHESQILRSATDNFLENVSVAGEWVLAWGQVNTSISRNSGSTPPPAPPPPEGGGLG